jgi:hypothetical protein
VKPAKVPEQQLDRMDAVEETTEPTRICKILRGRRRGKFQHVFFTLLPAESLKPYRGYGSAVRVTFPKTSILKVQN